MVDSRNPLVFYVERINVFERYRFHVRNSMRTSIVTEYIIHSGLSGAEFSHIIFARIPWVLKLVAHNRRVGVASFEGNTIVESEGVWIDSPTPEKISQIVDSIERQTDEDIKVLDPLGYRCLSFGSYKKEYDSYWIEVTRPLDWSPLVLMRCRALTEEFGVPVLNPTKEITRIVKSVSPLLESVLTFEYSELESLTSIQKETLDRLVSSPVKFIQDEKVRFAQGMGLTWNEMKDKTHWSSI